MVARDDAIAAAPSHGKHLIAWWPSSADDDAPSCIVRTLTLPLRWEQIPDEDALELDLRLWFEALCGGRDLLLHGQGHTFHGRMSAWCPDKAVAYNVSLTEMGEMSLESRYFVLGFLSGNEPDPPEDDEGNADEADMVAWRSATRRFRESGSWHGRWGTCEECGCVLLPDSSSDRCHEHQTAAPGP